MTATTRVQNHFTKEQISTLMMKFQQEMLDWHRVWFEAGKQFRVRNIIKFPKAGATSYFAKEAMLDALVTGRNQVFISQDESSADYVRAIMFEFAMEVGVRVRFDGRRERQRLVLSNGAEIVFSYEPLKYLLAFSSCVYVDDYFWMDDFRNTLKIVAAIALQKRYRRTFFSSLSSLSHDAYPFWSGELSNRFKPKAEQIKVDLNPKALQVGRLCEDGQWRQVVTVEGAWAAVRNLYNIDKLRMSCSKEEFYRLFMCTFQGD
ncbi:terminase large subunit domain-containing protein [Plesiomonas sp. ZOR0011]|uniref:terminase large subunit domain-containing protein n=1 Tax=Plesiomonas sp. ZOR0011 TaxID=1339230 RepID=UPI0006912DC4|nr:terminase family protein [Plesiomonas sp. ZOR0011]